MKQEFFLMKDLDLQVNWKAAVPFFLGVSMSQSDIKLPEGSFSAIIYHGNANILFSPNVILFNFVQYDNASKTAGLQSRFQCIVKPGNEILAWTG